MTNSNLATSFQKAQGYSVFYIFSQVFIFSEKQIGCVFLHHICYTSPKNYLF